MVFRSLRARCFAARSIIYKLGARDPEAALNEVFVTSALPSFARMSIGWK